MSLTIEEFRAALAADSRTLAAGKTPCGVHGCTCCKVPLQESSTGFRKLGDELVCSDCYYAKAGEIIASSPIPGLRGAR